MSQTVTYWHSCRSGQYDDAHCDGCINGGGGHAWCSRSGSIWCRNSLRVVSVGGYFSFVYEFASFYQSKLWSWPLGPGARGLSQVVSLRAALSAWYLPIVGTHAARLAVGVCPRRGGC